jgi:hypothetical protein
MIRSLFTRDFVMNGTTNPATRSTASPSRIRRNRDTTVGLARDGADGISYGQ